MLTLRGPVAVIACILMMIGLVYQAFNTAVAFSTDFVVPLPTVEQLKSTYGDKGLTRPESRELYHQVVAEEGRAWVDRSRREGADENTLAVGCSFLLWRARLYVRSRDIESDALGTLGLGIKDPYTHDGKHVVPRQASAPLWDMFTCPLRSESIPCPSYASLRSFRRSDENVIRLCTRTSQYYADRKASSKKVPSRQGTPVKPKDSDDHSDL